MPNPYASIHPGLRILVAIKCCHSWSRHAHVRAIAGTKDSLAVRRRIRLGHVLQLPSGALHLTAAGRGLVRTAGVEFATCSKCGEQFQRDAFTHANRGQCWGCSPESHSEEVGRAAE